MICITDRQEHAQALGYEYRPTEFLGTCLLCGHGLYPHCVVSERDRYGFDGRTELCQRCGLVFLNPRMTRESYLDFYARWYRPLVEAFSGEIPEADRNAYDVLYADGLCNAIGRYGLAPFRKTLLDIGGSTGVFAAAMRQRFGMQATVLDPAAHELDGSKDRNLEVIHGLVEDFDTHRTWDVISMVQTVDHLLEPLTVLRKVRTWIAQHGLFVIDFVDAGAMWRSFGIETTAKVDHPLYFTVATAECLLARAGFEPIYSGRSLDKRHVLYLCRPVPIVNLIPDAPGVERVSKELLG